jgi:glutathione S-transferase
MSPGTQGSSRAGDRKVVPQACPERSEGSRIFNSVDATYRSDLKELNELNFARFDAKLEQRIAELRAEMREGFARVDQRFAEFETKLTNRLFAFWVAQAATMVGLVFGVVKLVGR